MTHIIEIRAPLAINVQSELIMSMFEYKPTPNVAAKNDIAETRIDLALAFTASDTALCFSIPFVLSLLYLVVKRIA